MSSSPASLIKLEGVTKVFLTDEVETHALSGIHLDIRQGEYVAIAGPSGCGKSTLLSILGLLDSPTDGTYILNGRPVQSLSLPERARIRNREIGFIFQSFNLIGDLTVYENVELPLTYRGMPAAERKAAVTSALEKVGMGHRAKHLPSQLSGGQQQRVAVARALAGSPAVLLADEPTGNLDSKNGDSVMQLLADLHKGGATIVMVTHDTRFARHAEPAPRLRRRPPQPRHDPLNFQSTTPALFFTRWITHYCAPTFIFLAGLGAFLSGSRGKSRRDLSWFLFTRGLWLVLLEITYVQWAGWSFAFDWQHHNAIVIWAIGWSMVALSALVYLPVRAVGVFGVVMIVAHNAFDGVKSASLGALAPLWKILHEGGSVDLGAGHTLAAGYPLIPWIGVMAAGYGFGHLLLHT
eukprot:gene38099-biopygen25295